MITPTEGKMMYCILFTCNAAGNILSPYVIYKDKNLHTTQTVNGSENTTYNCTNSGWMEDPVFEIWFKTYFIPYLNRTGTLRPVIVIFDGHNLHMTYSNSNMYCRKQMNYNITYKKSNFCKIQLYSTYLSKLEIAFAAISYTNTLRQPMPKNMTLFFIAYQPILLASFNRCFIGCM